MLPPVCSPLSIIPQYATPNNVPHPRSYDLVPPEGEGGGKALRGSARCAVLSLPGEDLDGLKHCAHVERLVKNHMGHFQQLPGIRIRIERRELGSDGIPAHDDDTDGVPMGFYGLENLETADERQAQIEEQDIVVQLAGELPP